MSRPLVSVLVLAYNHEPYLGKAIESILGQHLDGAIEVLIGEDHSSDGTRAVAEEYAKARPRTVRVISSDQNVGMHENNARLLSASTGEFVAYCEGDDFWSSDAKLRVQVDHLRRHPTHAGVHSDVDHLIERSGQRSLRPSYWANHLPGKASTTTFDDLLELNVVQTCSVLLRGDIARSFVGSPLDLARYAVADWPMFLNATMSGPLGYLPESLAVYRRVPGSVTNRGALATERRVADQLRMLTDVSRMHSHDPARLAAGMRRTRRALVLTGVRACDRSMVQRWADASRAAGDHDAVASIAGVLTKVPGSVHALGVFLRARQSLIERIKYRRETAL